MKKLKNWWKNMIYRIGDWATDPYPGYVSNADAYVGSWFQGAGLSATIWIIVICIYCGLTGSKLVFAKR